MTKKLEKAVMDLLGLIYEEAEQSYKTRINGEWRFNIAIWKKNDPKMYKRWSAVSKLLPEQPR